MKTRFFLSLVAIVCLTFIFGCSDDKDEDVCGQTGIIYGPSVQHGGETYESIVICGQTWLKRNLNYAVSNSKCVDGSSLSDDNTWACNNYGRLYDWSTAMALPSYCNRDSCPVQSKHQGICPVGWHIPSRAEWDGLVTAVGGATKLKAKSGWDNNDNGTDDFGFSAMPGGYGAGDIPNFFGKVGCWWSANEIISYGGSGIVDSRNAYAYLIGLVGNGGKNGFNSVRCIKD